MKKLKLSKDEQALIDAVEAGKFESVLTGERQKALQTIARNTSKRISE